MRACSNCDHFFGRGMMLADHSPSEQHDAPVEQDICRRFPPRWAFCPEDSNPDTRWPEVHRAHRCGEWSPIEAELPIC